MKKILIGGMTLCALLLVGCQKITTTNNGEVTNTGNILTGEDKTISSFQECVDAGFPIMESYPRQCSDGITSFTEEINEPVTGSETMTGIENTTGINKTLTGLDNSTGTDTSVLEARIKAMLERRAQAENSGEQEGPITTETNQNVTEEDIETLENIIDEIIKK